MKEKVKVDMYDSQVGTGVDRPEAKAVCSSPESSKKRLHLFWNGPLLRISRAASRPLQLSTAHETLISQRSLEDLLRARHEESNGPEALPS